MKTEPIETTKIELLETPTSTPANDESARPKARAAVKTMSIPISLVMIIAIAIGYITSYFIVFHVIDFGESRVMAFFVIGGVIAGAMIQYNNSKYS